MAIIRSASDELKTYTNEELHTVLLELQKLSLSPTPAQIEMSAKMKKLFALEKREYSYWSDQYHEVSAAIESEIVQRFYAKTL
jgi:hypothetical protein